MIQSFSRELHKSRLAQTRDKADVGIEFHRRVQQLIWSYHGSDRAVVKKPVFACMDLASIRTHQNDVD
jgi:hypothetical protein